MYLSNNRSQNKHTTMQDTLPFIHVAIGEKKITPTAYTHPTHSRVTTYTRAWKLIVLFYSFQSCFSIQNELLFQNNTCYKCMHLIYGVWSWQMSGGWKITVVISINKKVLIWREWIKIQTWLKFKITRHHYNGQYVISYWH